MALSRGVTLEDQGNKFKLYLQSKKNVMLLEQLYSYRLHNESIMSKREDSANLEDSLSDLQTQVYNWNKLMYYVDIANYNVEEMRETYMKKLDKLPSEINLSEEDFKIYCEKVSRYTKKLKHFWNM